jgi:hypothetical protein
VKELMDRLLNWSGGTYVGASTLVVLGLAVAEFALGVPVLVGDEIRYVHKAPEWLIAVPMGVYAVILTLYVVQRPVNTLVEKKNGGEKPPGG